MHTGYGTGREVIMFFRASVSDTQVGFMICSSYTHVIWIPRMPEYHFGGIWVLTCALGTGSLVIRI